MTSERFDALFDGPPRQPESPMTQREMDLACSIQEVTEEVMLRLSRTLRRETGERNLALAGGVALNCVGNGRILREGLFDGLWIQPAAGDAGGALGAALAVWHQLEEAPRETFGDCDSMRGSFLGPSYSNEQIEQFLKSKGIQSIRLDDEELFDCVAEELASEKVVGWFQGRMEFGPRALGARSILGDARSPKMQSVMNLKIKYRESFRPFAPAVLWDRQTDYFDLAVESPYMLLVAPVLENRRTPRTDRQAGLWGIDLLNVPRSDIPAVTHLDYSARVQSVHQETNPRFYKLLKAFEARTRCGVIVNTSFNVRGEPIVCSLEDAYRCFMRTEMDALVLENFLLLKTDQKTWAESTDWKAEFVLD